MFNTIPELLADVRSGKMVIIVDDPHRENEGDLVVSTDFVSPQTINFMSGQARGLICVALSYEQVKKLELPLMVNTEENRSPHKTAFTVSVEASAGVTTGISASDRARTIQALSSPNAKPGDIISPGHVFPIRAHKGGVLKRAGHTEASVDLCRLAGLNPSAVICEIIKPDGNMARVPELKQFAEQHGIKIGTIEDLIRYRLSNEIFVKETVKAPFLSSMLNNFEARVFQDTLNNREHLVFSLGDITTPPPLLVRMHAQCLPGDLFGGQVSSSGHYLSLAFKKISEEGRGLFIYLLTEQGKTGCLEHRIRQYVKGDGSGKTMSDMAFLTDAKDYGVGAQILHALSVSKVRLLTNTKQKRAGLKGFDIEIVEHVPLK